MTRPLTGRERVLVLLGAAGLALLMIWMFVLGPALQARAAHMARLVELDRLSGMLDRMPLNGGAKVVTDLPPLRQRVTQSASAAAIEIRRLDPQGDALSISLGDVAFTDLAGWLAALTTTQGIRIVGAEIARRPEPGIVTARLVVEGAG